MKVLIVLFSLFVMHFAFAQSSEIEIIVASEQVDCHNNANEKCFQAKKVTDPYWTFEIAAIEGFDYEEGNEYHLKLSINPPSVPGEAPVYNLVTVMDKKKIN
jgi:hypothetical protein